jgi:hypothetical protein
MYILLDIACSTSVDSGACLINHILKKHTHIYILFISLAKSLKHTLTTTTIRFNHIYEVLADYQWTFKSFGILGRTDW